jgi:hypothetical protein
VRYVRGNPAVSDLPEARLDEEPSAFSLVGGLLCGALLPLLLAVAGAGLLLGAARQWWLRWRGKVLAAEFVRGAVVSSGRERWRLEMEYRFVSPAGRLITGKDSCPTEREQAPAPRPGQAGCVVYLSDRLYRLL